MKRRSHPTGRPFTALVRANALSAVGTGMTTAAMPLLASIRPPSELLLGIIAAAGLAPGLLLAVPAGMLVDRYDRSRVLVMADVARAVVMAAGALALLIGDLPGAALAAITFLIGAGETVFVTASQSAVPSYVSPDALDHANGRLQVVDDVGREFVGPPLGSLIFRLGTALPFVADMVSYLVSAALLTRLPAAVPVADEGTRASVSMRPAWSFFRRSRPLVVLAGAMFVLSLSGSGVIALLVLVVTERLHLDRGWFGVMLTVIAVGATAAGLVTGRLRARLSARGALAAAVLLNGASYILLGTTSWWPLAVVALFAWGFTVTVGNIISVGIRQRMIRADLMGRVMGLFRTALGAGGVIGALGAGVLAGATSVGTVAVTAGALQLPVAIAVLWAVPRDPSPDRSSDGLDETAT
jgi:MFS family permease